MTTISRDQATTILRKLGWRVRTTSEYVTVVKNFQRGWNLGPALEVDGSVGRQHLRRPTAQRVPPTRRQEDGL